MPADNSIKCLVVDDNPVNHTMAASFLLTHNIKPEVSLSGAEALKMIEEKASADSASDPVYDIIFMDHMMPGMDGIETTKRIREWENKRSQAKQMPIIAFSANTSPDIEKMFMDAGMNSFLSKPIVAEELDNILKQWLPADKLSSAKVPKKALDPKTEHLLEELANIKGLDLKAGLSNFGQHNDGYFLALRQFSEQCDSYIKELKAALKTESWEDYSIKVHALKGVLAAFGMQRLSQWAANLEKASKKEMEFSPDICHEETTPFCDALAKFNGLLCQTSLNTSLDTEKGAKPKGEKKILQEQIVNLKKACIGCSSEDVEKIFKALSAYEWDKETNQKLKNISALTSSYQFEEALEKIELIGLS